MARLTDDNYTIPRCEFSQATEPSSVGVSIGSWWDDTTNDYFYYWDGAFWQQNVQIGDRGVFGGGTGAATLNTIDYISISSTGNARDFGDLTASRWGPSACSNGTNDRGVFGGGYTTSNSNIIDYITISICGNANDFGDLLSNRRLTSSCSNGSNDRGVSSGYVNNSTLEYITISSIGNSIAFGTLNQERYGMGACSNGTNDRGIFGGGVTPISVGVNIIDYITISSTGNAIDFGDLTQERYYISATSNDVNDRGVFGGGYLPTTAHNIIDYITISSTGNATDFGDLTLSRQYISATSNGPDDRGVFGPGRIDDGSYLNIIDYITISTTGNATDFGDTTELKLTFGATSNSAN